MHLVPKRHHGRKRWNGQTGSFSAICLIEPSGGRHFLYTGDLGGLRKRLIEAGWESPEIEDGTPGPKQEMSICDPDRHVLTIAEIEN
jgi:hypothetical protein